MLLSRVAAHAQGLAEPALPSVFEDHLNGCAVTEFPAMGGRKGTEFWREGDVGFLCPP